MSTGRRGARRAALFVLYQWDVTGQPLASLYEGELDPYTKELAEGVAAEASEEEVVDGTGVVVGVVDVGDRRGRLALGPHRNGAPGIARN